MPKRGDEDDEADLFGDSLRPSRRSDPPPAPLADRMRPRTWEEILGQEHLTAPGAPLRRLHDEGKLSSLILWGPPGSGKTTLAHLLAEIPGHAGERFSAVLSGVKEVREVVARADRRWARDGIRTVLFVDEIHRFNRAQQDAFLPHVESGRIILIGATTENPSFEVIAALLSRCTVYVLRPLEERHLRELGERALQDGERGLGAAQLALDEAGWSVLLRHAALDARRLLNTLEMLASATRPDASGARRPTAEWVARVCERQGRSPVGPEEHFDLISALHKSLRGSDPHASLYWLARLLEGGEDPRYVLRRLLRFASEDVGLADPSALHHATAAAAAYQWVGSPEGHLAIAQLVLHLALCPKSNSVYMSYGRAASLVADRGPLPVPLRIRNAPTRLMEGLGYGAGYRYPHESPGHWIPESYLPDGIPESDRILYRSSRQGREADLVESHRKRTRGFYEGTLTGAEASEGPEASEPAGGAERPAVDGPPPAAGESPEAADEAAE